MLYKPILMKPQLWILFLFLFLTMIVGIVFGVIYHRSSSSSGESAGIKHPKKIRFYFFLGWFFVLVVLLLVTLPRSPYYLYAEEVPTEVVYATARQYSYLMSHQAVDPYQSSPREEIIIPVNEIVEFRVTSLDVNHGFAIYNEHSELITQTQAMPGYVNRLRWKFTEPGSYQIFCLEFCGMGHAMMKSAFTVR